MKNMIYGRNSVKEWIDSSLNISQILISQDSHGKVIHDILTHANKHAIQVNKYPKHKFDEMMGNARHQGIAAKVKLPPYSEIEDIFALAKEKNEPVCLAILDHIQDPHNLGAIIRSADGAGIHGVIIPKDQSVGITPAVLKTSAGAALHIPIVMVTNLVRTMKELKDQGLWFTGCSEHTDKTYYEMDYKGPTGLVLGNEGAGLRRLVKEECDFLAAIPMRGKINSLNVSVAASVMFYEVRRQRG